MNSEVAIIIHAAVRQASRWALAAAQDKNPIVRFLHASYSVGIYDLLIAQIGTDTINSLIKDDIRDMAEWARRWQDQAEKELFDKCASTNNDDLMKSSPGTFRKAFSLSSRLDRLLRVDNGSYLSVNRVSRAL